MIALDLSTRQGGTCKLFRDAFLETVVVSMDVLDSAPPMPPHPMLAQRDHLFDALLPKDAHGVAQRLTLERLVRCDVTKDTIVVYHPGGMDDASKKNKLG